MVEETRMANRVGGDVLRTVRSVAVDATDRELLARFADGDEAAFSALVNRHAGLVIGVCRRALPTIQDAEDACQAVFLILATKASSGRWQPSIANWLYTTARRVALKTNRTAARRVKREGQAVPKSGPSPLDEMTGREAFAALDQELDRLAPIYREPLVLCYLQGMTRDEAAARLGVPLATLKSQLDRGRKKLGDALSKRGIVMGAGLLGAVATSSVGVARAKRIQSILTTISGTPTLPVAALAKEAAVNGMGKLQCVAVVAVGLALLGAGYVSVSAAPDAESQPLAVAQDDKPSLSREADDSVVAPPKKTEPAEFPTERTITGKVLGVDGKPIVADLYLIWADDKPQSLGKTNPDGTFRVVVPQREPWASLVASASGLGLGFVKLEASTPATVTLHLAKDLPIRGQLIDTEGKPVIGANIRLRAVCDLGVTGRALSVKSVR
jgi:RNA polymerase sigma factor (sigma-70 family)